MTPPFESHNPTDYSLWIHGILTALIGIGMAIIGAKQSHQGASLQRLWSLLTRVKEVQDSTNTHFQRTIRQLEERKP